MQRRRDCDILIFAGVKRYENYIAMFKIEFPPSKMVKNG